MRRMLLPSWKLPARLSALALLGCSTSSSSDWTDGGGPSGGADTGAPSQDAGDAGGPRDATTVDADDAGGRRDASTVDAGDAGEPRDAGMGAADATDGSEAGVPINSVNGVVLANDPTIFYSPGNWALQKPSSMESVNAGAYFRTIFSGTTCTLNFDASADGMPLSEVYVSVDSAAPVKSTIASAADCTPASTTAEHTLEFIVKSTSQALNRWNPPPATGILFTSLKLDVGAYTRKPDVLPCQGIIFGDSITEGIYTTPNNTAENDRSDATLGWAFLQKQLLKCEIGVVGFGYQGFSHGGNGSVPVFGDAWPYIFSNIARGFDSIGFIVVNQGTNDGSNDETSLEETFLTGILGATPSTDPIVILRPFNGSQSSNWQTAIAATNSPRVHFVDTTGFFDSSESVDGLHPNAAADAMIAPMIAAQVSPILK